MARLFVPRGRSSGARSSADRAASRSAGLNFVEVLRGSNLECVAPCGIAMGAGPQPCGAGARRGFARRHIASGGEGASAHLVALLEASGSCCLACSTWAWARGVPASGRHRCTFARAHGDGVGDALPQVRRPRVTAPRMMEMSAPWWRAALCGDAALVEECVGAWEGGAGNARPDGSVSFPLRVHCLGWTLCALGS